MLSALCVGLRHPVRSGDARLGAGTQAPTDGVWAPVWYEAVERSTGFAAPRREAGFDELPDALKPIAAAARPIYERLARHKLTGAAIVDRAKRSLRPARRSSAAPALTRSRARRIRDAPMPTLVLPFPADQSRTRAVGSARHPLVCARLYRRPRPRLAADSPRSSPNDRYWGGATRPSRDSIDDLLVYCAFGVIIGGRLGNVLFYDPEYYFAHPLEIFKVWEGGMAFHGGLIGAFVGILLFARRYPRRR